MRNKSSPRNQEFLLRNARKLESYFIREATNACTALTVIFVLRIIEDIHFQEFSI